VTGDSGRDARPPGDVTVGKLALRLTGRPPGAAGDDTHQEARDLARLIALGLADSVQLPPAAARIKELRLQVTARGGEDAEALASRIVDALITRITQSSETEA
jgi:hypothetical protein